MRDNAETHDLHRFFAVVVFSLPYVSFHSMNYQIPDRPGDTASMPAMYGFSVMPETYNFYEAVYETVAATVAFSN